VGGLSLRPLNMSDLPLAESVFPNRNFLMISEVSKVLKCTNQHVLDLIEEGQLVAVDISGPAVDRNTARRCLRIPVSSYDNFLRTRVL